MAAIYMWFENDLVVLTTTLYPVEVTDYLQLTVDIADGRMDVVPQDEGDFSGALESVLLKQILNSYGPDQDSADFSGGLGTVVLQQILNSYGPDQDEADFSGGLVSVVLDLKLVIGDTPDEKLQLDCDIYPPGCSMTP